VLTDVIDVLRCPICSGRLELEASSVHCADGHAFDMARQGYANLMSGGAGTGTADTAAMVQARAEFLAAGHYAPLADAMAAITDEVRSEGGSSATEATGRGGMILDAGAGTGYYLGSVLQRQPRSSGLALDVSKFAVRRAARVHPRIGAAVWDVWQPLPIVDDSIDIVLNVFAPRNGAEFHRILRPEGTLLVVTPTQDHLAELVGRTGMLTVDELKEERLERTLADHFRLDRRDELTIPLSLNTSDVRNVAAMGPSAWHLDERALDREVAALPSATHTNASFALSVYRPT
jgi:SAM-dependent methyltransferase